MISSRKIEDLIPDLQAKVHALTSLCTSAGIDLLVYSTYRDYAAQDALYARGRTITSEDGHRVFKVTNARGGQSFHQFRRAFDCVPMVHGKAVWGTTGSDELTWQKLGALGVSLGLEWGGHWTSFKEYPHFQLTGGHSVSYYAQLQPVS